MTVYDPQQIGEVLNQLKAIVNPDESVTIPKGNVPEEALAVLAGESPDNAAGVNTGPDTSAVKDFMFGQNMGGTNGK